MIPRPLIFALTPVFVMSAAAQEAPPEKALKYHEALLKRPQNAALFDRFFGAWIDEQPVETLDAFLVSRAEKNGGQEWSVLARYQLRRGQEDNALASFAKAIDAVPDDPALPMERAKIRLRRMEFEAARADLAKVAAGKDEALALEAAKLTGKSWLREGKSEEAVKAWDALLAAHPGDEDLLEDLVESAAADGETAQALTYVAKLIEASKDPYKKTLRSMRRGDLLAQAGKNDEAAEAYAATLAQVGEGSWLEREVLAQIEKVFRKQDRLADLTAELKKLAEANPRRLLIHRQLAKLEASQGETDSAIGRFREVLKRSPGDRELREEFVRLLADGERFDDAAAELEKMIELAPTEAELQLQLAALRSRQGKPDAVLAALKKAQELLGKDEGTAIRISGLMFQYDQNAAGEALLKEAAAAQGAGPAPAEALAAQYGRLNRKAEAVDLLKKVGASEEVDVVIRAASSISALGESGAAFEILSARAEKFSSEMRFLAALSQTALAANKPADAVAQAVKLVRLSKQTAEIGENIGLANRVLVAADKVLEWRNTLEAQAARTPAETCLLAELVEGQGDFDAVAKLLDGATDPLVLHFHAALLDRRGEFDQAIAALSRLADTDEGRKAAFFKDMSELQQRAGKTQDALATVERWKQSAPGDKSAWIAGSRLLRESGKPEEAVKMTRQAVARFEGDADLAASLASLHEESGQWSDAEAIYWRLYDESQAPSDQARWAAQLAQLAMKNGKTEDLDEKLQERARGNRRSIGPILAQAELARVTQNDDKRRDLLLEAVRLQPKDVDLRLQIANLEEQSGNPDRVVAVLEEALAQDPSGRIRAALAQAYLRQGQTVKGMRELQAMSGKQASDPRSIESNAAVLAGAGMYEEAIRFMRESLPDGGDWRCRYLLATMLEQDGREAEALPIFLSLQQAAGDLPGIPPNPQSQKAYLKNYAEELRGLMVLMMSVQTAYAHQQQQQSYRYSGSTMTGPFVLPEDAEDARRMSMVHLSKLAKKSGDGGKQIQAQIRAGGVTNAEFMADFVESGKQGQPDLPALLQKYPDEPGLLGMALMYGNYGYNGRGTTLDAAIVKKAMEKPDRLSPQTRFRAAVYVTNDAKADDPAWAQLSAAADVCLADKDQDAALQIGYQLIQMMGAEDSKLPPVQREAFKKIILDLVAKTTDGEKLDQIRLSAMSVAGTREQWIDALNVMVKRSRQKPAAGGVNPQMAMRMSYRSMRGYNPWMNGETPFALPYFQNLSFSSLPNGYLYQIRPKAEAANYGGTGIVDPKELLKFLDRVESPVLRLWIAIRAEDAEAIAKAAAATPPKEEAADFELLRAYQAAKDKKFTDAYDLLEKTRAGRASDQNYATWLNTTLVAVASEMKPEERAKIADSLRTVLVQCRQVLGIQGAPVLAAKATQLGYEDLAKRFQPPAVAKTAGGGSAMGPAGFGQAKSRSSSSSSSGQTGSIEKVVKFAAEKKYEAAAREALLLIRQAKVNPWNSSYEMRELIPKLGEEVRAELMKLVEPGDSKSLTKRLEYADICIALGKNEQALAMLELLIVERPDDASIAGKLAFLLPPAQSERVRSLMTKAARSDEFVMMAHQKAQELSNSEDNKVTCDFFETLTAWLEGARPADLAGANLTWISYHAKELFGTQNTNGLPNLLSESGDKAEDKAAADRRDAIAKRLALAMLRQPSICEEGFRLYSAVKAWKTPPEELDAKAREALLVAKIDKASQYSGGTFFMLRQGNGSSSSGEDLSENSSVRWLTGRLAKAKSPDEILPPAYLKDLGEKNPKVGELVSALAGISTVEQLGKLWNSETLKNGYDPVTIMLRQGVLSRAGSTPGAAKFFLSRIREIPADKFQNGLNRGDQSADMNLMNAALTAGIGGKQEELDSICTAISKVIFGEKIDWESKDNNQKFYQQINAMENILGQQSLDPVASMRLQRTLFRLGIPVGNNEYQLFRGFQNHTYQNIGEVEAMLDSLGCFADVPAWEPLAAVIVEVQQPNGKMTYNRQDKLLIERMSSYMNMSFSRSDLVKRLRERKPATFGALITAAAMSSGKERTDITAAAFAAAGPALAKLAASRVEGYSLLLPWLPAEAVAKLPPSFREKAKVGEEIRRKEMVKRADEFLANTPNPNRSYSNAFDESRQFLGDLAVLDFKKAVQVFLESERRFTTSLTQGGRLSSYTSNDFQISERDEAVGSLINNSDSPFYQNHVLGLRFIATVLGSPEGGRFSLADNNYNGQCVLSRLGSELHNSEQPAKDSKEPAWFRSLREAVEMPEDVWSDALVAVTTYEINNNSQSNAAYPTDERKVAGAARDELVKKSSPVLEPLIKAVSYRELAVGIIGWNADTVEGRALTIKTLVSLIEDKSIAEPTRMQLAFNCVSKAPAIINDPAIAAVIVPLYETYCDAGRSAVNPLSIAVIKAFGTANITAETKPLAQRMNNAFWKNANAPKPAGHPSIPQQVAPALFVAAARSGDEALAQKLLGQAKLSIIGDLPTIASLVSARQFELAKSLLSEPGRVYRSAKISGSYDRTLEDGLTAFGQSGVDPLQLLRLECQFLQSKAGEGDSAPQEKGNQRSLRLAAAYQKDPPKDKLIQAEMLAAITESGYPAVLALRDETAAYAKACNFETAFRDWSANTGSLTDLNPRFMTGRLDSIVCRHAAMSDLLRGETGLLEKVAAGVLKVPPSSNGNNSYVPRNYHRDLMGSACFWSSIAAGDGTMEGFEKALKTFEDLTAFCDSHREFDTDQINPALALCQFLSYWSGQPDRFKALCGRLPGRKEIVKKFETPEGLSVLFETVSRNRVWKTPEFSDTRKKLLTAVFSKPSLAPLYPPVNGWTNRMARTTESGDFQALTDPMPASFIPEVRAQLMDLRGDQLVAKHPTDAIAAYRAALQECQPGPECNELRAMIKYDLAQALFNTKQTEEAKTLYASIPPAEVGKWYKDKYDKLGKSLAAPEKPKN
ncbi:MAG: tetratricopeptide repeat protein [Luteolibacter sp.]